MNACFGTCVDIVSYLFKFKTKRHQTLGASQLQSYLQEKKLI